VYFLCCRYHYLGCKPMYVYVEKKRFVCILKGIGMPLHKRSVFARLILNRMELVLHCTDCSCLRYFLVRSSPFRVLTIPQFDAIICKTLTAAISHHLCAAIERLSLPCKLGGRCQTPLSVTFTSAVPPPSDVMRWPGASLL